MTTLDLLLTQIMEDLDPSNVEAHMYLSAMWIRFKELELDQTQVHLFVADSVVDYLRQVQSWLRIELGWYWLGWSARSRKMWQIDEDLTHLIQIVS